MSIYKDQPELSFDFVFVPLEVAFTQVIRKYQPLIDEIQRDGDMPDFIFNDPVPLFDRLYYSPVLKKHLVLNRS